MQISGLDYSYGTELDNFFNPSLQSTPSSVPSPSAFCQARKKIKHSVFIDLNETLTDSYYNEVDILDWHGFRPICVDGSSAHVPDTPENIDYFSGWKARLGGGDVCPKARISFAYDPLNKLIVDAVMSPTSTGEDSLAWMHLERSGPLDLNIYDRGYASFRLFKEHETRDLHYCARIPTELFTVLCKPLLVLQRHFEMDI